MLPIDTDVFPEKKGVYVVGGAIRDLLCGRTPVDYDLAVKTAPDKFARLLAANTGGKAIKFGKHGHAIHRVVLGDCHFDITPLNGKTIENDLLRRDFTINALALEVSSGRLIDLTGGSQDIAAKTVRMVKRDVFRRDPVRLVRAFRMAAAFDFSIDKDTEATIARDSGLIRNSAGERIRDELFKILNSTDSHAQLASMAGTGLLFGIIPELMKLKSCMSDEKQPGNLFEQTLAAYNHLENLLYSPRPEQPESMGRLLQELSTGGEAVLLKWSVLLQNIGLPSARPTTAGGSGLLNGHAARGAAMSRDICRRLRFSRRQSDTIEFIIRHHLEPFALFKARQEDAPADRAFIRFYMTCGDRTPAILLHALAGAKSRKAAEAFCDQRFADFVTQGVDCYYSILKPRAATPPPLNGKDLIKYFGLKPSAAFKEILAALEEEHLAGENFTREQALELVVKLLNKVTV